MKLCSQGFKWVLTGVVGLMMTAMVSSASYSANLEHQTQVELIAKVTPLYSEAAKQPWKAIKLTKIIKPGMLDANINLIRQRLLILQDLSNDFNASSSMYDPELVKAVQHFQQRHGYDPDGVIGSDTIAALNISPAERLRELQLNSQRWSLFPATFGREYIWINIPTYELDVINDGVAALHMRVIVGKPDRPTPELFSNVETLVLNPTWNVPQSLIKKDIIPNMMKDRNYLAENKIHVYANWQPHAPEINPHGINWERIQKYKVIPFRFTQDANDDNSLGLVKFIFQNESAIYLHDTPHKNLFESEKRAFSSGCIRLSEPFKLLEYLINHDDTIDAEKIQDQLDSGQTKYVRLSHTIPIYIAYITAWVDDLGVVHFRDDIYHKDSTLVLNPAPDN